MSFWNKKIKSGWGISFEKFAFLFDHEFYKSSYKRSEDDPETLFRHYIKEGWKKGYNPHPLFDTNFYLNRLSESDKKKYHPLVHFVEFGVHQQIDPHPLFNSKFYLKQNSDVEKAGANPFVHYILFGLKENRVTHPLFDPQFYLQKYPDVISFEKGAMVHFLLFGGKELRQPNFYFDSNFYNENVKGGLNGENPLLHFILKGYKEKISPNRNFDFNKFYKAYPEAVNAGCDPFTYLEKNNIIFGQGQILNISQSVKDELIKCATLEPIITNTYNGSFNKLYSYYITDKPITNAFEIILKKVEAKPTHVIVMPWLHLGGADWVQICHINALASIKENRVLVLTTEQDNQQAIKWIENPDVKIISIEKVIKEEVKLPVDKVELLKILLTHLQAKVIHIANSHAGFQAIRIYGKGLSNFSKIYTSAYCHDYTPDLLINGYAATFVRWGMPFWKNIFTDNKSFINVLKNEYGFLENEVNKFVDVKYPVRKLNGLEGKFLKGKSESRKILWAGRIVYQKRPELLMEIAKALPEFEFHVHGNSPDIEVTKKLSAIKNIKLRGGYSNYEEIIAEDYMCYLHTSAWDGLPNVLLETALAGLPIISASIGGISELINDSTGYLVQDHNTVNEYIEKIKFIDKNRNDSLEKAKRAFDYVVNHHNMDNFKDRLKAADYL